MRVRHYGNTANNAYYNALLLDRFEGIASELPFRMFGLAHGISAPSWEAVEFAVPDAAWVSTPDWSQVPGAVEINSRFTDIVPPSAEVVENVLPSGYRMPGLMPGARRWANAWIGRRGWEQPLVDLRSRQSLAKRPQLAEEPGVVDVLYGADSLAWMKLAESSRQAVSFEHGTIRWVGDPDDNGGRRQAYREQLKRSQHLWVTNLDPRSLEIAEDIMPGRWSALPHPYVFDARVPFAGSDEQRRRLLEATSSEALVLLPASQNWDPSHDKGSIKALKAFVEMRRSGREVGLVAVEWGLQLGESKLFLESEGVAAHVVWVPPMARFGLQRMMADVDVVWDQFGLDAFGGLALRATEQGTPLVSRGLAPEGEKLIGGPAPWFPAATPEEIVRQTTAVLDDMGRRGRATVIAETTARYRTWLDERHSAQLTAQLQREVYERVIDGSHGAGEIAPDRWAQLLGERAREDN